MCQDDSVARAFAQIGRPCPGAAVAAAPAPAQPVAERIVAHFESVDPAVVCRQQAAAVRPVPTQGGWIGQSTRPAYCSELAPDVWAKTPQCTQ